MRLGCTLHISALLLPPPPLCVRCPLPTCLPAFPPPPMPMPRQAWFTVWMQLLGFTDFAASSLMAAFSCGCALGGLLGALRCA